MDEQPQNRKIRPAGQFQRIGRETWLKLLLGFALTAFFTFLFPGTETVEQTAHEGTVWTERTLYAPFSYPIYKDLREYDSERAAALAGVKPVVERDEHAPGAAADSLSARVLILKRSAELYKKWKTTRSAGDSSAFIELSYKLNLPVVSWDSIARIAAGPVAGGPDRLSTGFSLILNLVRMHMEGLYAAGIIDSGGLKRQHASFALRRGAIEEPIPSAGIRTMTEALNELRARLADHLGEGSTMSKLAYALGAGVLTPNIVFDAGQTAREAQASVENVPRTLGYVQEGERIVGKNERVTAETGAKLDSYYRARADRGNEVDARGQTLGSFFHVLLILSLYAAYLLLFRKRIFGDVKQLAAIAMLFVFVGAVALASRLVNSPLPLQYLILVPVASMLLTMLFDSRVAFYGTVTLALLVGGIRGSDYNIMVASLIAGTLGAYTVRDLKSRTQIFRSLGFIFLGYAVAIIALGLERFEDTQSIAVELALAFANAFISAVLAYAILIMLEKFFGIASDLRLVELADLNHPLLQRLSEEAPGTFHHSITLGNLAEAAAADIGANTVLAKVGAYYHDVGKLVKPEYFIENQTGQANRHAKLKPRMSAKIIIAHVTEGMELARQYGIPEKIVDFIPQHHGTTTISYFFDKALRLAAARKNNKETVTKDDYRYPGPKPQSREAAIVMLADTVEATTRSATDLTAQKLEATIDAMIKQRYVEGELDECELTMRDLARIKEAFLQILIGIHHHRIQYPAQIAEAREEEPIVEEYGSGEPVDPEEPEPALEENIAAAARPRTAPRQPRRSQRQQPPAPPVPDAELPAVMTDNLPAAESATEYDTFGDSPTNTSVPTDDQHAPQRPEEGPVAGSFRNDGPVESDLTANDPAALPPRDENETPEYVP